MTANLYCARQDVTRRLPPGSVTSPGGLIESCIATTNVITFDGHGLETDDVVTVRATDGGTLSAPLVAGTSYYAIRLSNSQFSLAAAAAGSAIDITSNGVSMSVAREPRFDEFIEEYSRWADGFLPGHLVPLEDPIHPTVKGVVADLTAKRILNISGQDSAIVTTAEVAAMAILKRFASGLALRGHAATASANKAITSTYSSTDTDPRGWGSGNLP